MTPKALTLAMALVCTAVAAQPSRVPRESERAPRPDSASNARVGGWCDALTGEKKKQCLREVSSRQREQSATGDVRGTCDPFLGPDKERCLRQGGTIEVDAKLDPGARTGGPASP